MNWNARRFTGAKKANDSRRPRTKLIAALSRALASFSNLVTFGLYDCPANSELTAALAAALPVKSLKALAIQSSHRDCNTALIFDALGQSCRLEWLKFCTASLAAALSLAGCVSHGHIRFGSQLMEGRRLLAKHPSDIRQRMRFFILPL